MTKLLRKMTINQNTFSGNKPNSSFILGLESLICFLSQLCLSVQDLYGGFVRIVLFYDCKKIKYNVLYQPVSWRFYPALTHCSDSLHSHHSIISHSLYFYANLCSTSPSFSLSALTTLGAAGTSCCPAQSSSRSPCSCPEAGRIIIIIIIILGLGAV